MAHGKFVELLLESDVGPTNSTRYKIAYQSLVNKPQQLFTLLLEKEISNIFFSGFGSYGKQLAELLKKLPEYIKPSSISENKLGFKEEDIKLWIFEEALRAFLFSLIANDYPEISSQEAMANIVMVVIELSKPGMALQLLGSRLGEVPLILSRLIADGSIGNWSRDHPESFRSIVSNKTALEAWARTITNLAEHCFLHYEGSRNVLVWQRMRDLVQSFPCNGCQVISSKIPTENVLPRSREFNPHNLGLDLKIFDSLLGDHLGPWKIVLSAKALKDLKEAAHSGNFDHTRERLLALASGDWMRRSLRRPTKLNSQFKVPVYQISCKGNIVILWQVDIAFDERHDQDFQVIKVWAICAYREVEDVCKCVIQAQGTYTSARVAACQTRDLETAKRTVFPKRVQLSETPDNQSDEEFAAAMNGEMPPMIADRRMIEGSPLLGKFYSLTTIVLENVHPGALSAVFPVDISAEEVHIINHFQTPAFILGRSGTGKTTCLIYKLASRYLSSKITDETPVRQLLLTRSKNLAQKLKLYTKRLINTRMGITDMDSQNAETDTVWDDSEEDTTQNLLSLEGEDFPLVCTFNYFLRLLENLVEDGNQRNVRRVKAIKRTLKPVNIVTFSIDYWRRFPTALRQRIPADLAFTDIMGVIKGSASADSNLEPLSREAYVNRRWKLAPNFSTDSERNSVYTLYEHYENIKRMRGEVDVTDRVIHVLRELNKNPELQKMVEGFLDEVYIDEVQDQRPLEIEVLLTLIRDPWGIHFAGDTAQCISKDSQFRFANAKALFYTRFSKLFHPNGNQSFLVPTLLPLSHNFRSHKGILSLASFVMELLYTGFPDLVDKLPPEIGENLGPKPVLYIGSGLLEILLGTENTAQSEEFFPKEKPGEKEESAEVTEFGEERVILVRDEQTQAELEKQIKKKQIENSPLVLTILQSKGMEFEDVFLYNFFTTSSYSSDFTVLEDLLRERHSSDMGSAGEHARHVDWAKKHIVLCSELKVSDRPSTFHLYVGVTRARTRLWIVESNENITPPIINLFNKTASKLFPKKYPESLVEIVRQTEFEASNLRKRFQSTKQTSPARWRELAYELMANRAYTQASTCFKKAKDKCGEALADAYVAEKRGMEYRASGSKKQYTLAFEEACELFRKAGRISKAVECQEAIGNFVAAGEILSQDGAHEEAAFIFVKEKEPKKAAREYHEIGKHEKALATYFHAGLYNELAIYLKDFSPAINASSREQNSRLCYVLLIHEEVGLKFRSTVISSLGSEANQEDTFREFGMMNDVFHLYKRQKRHVEAYEVAVRIGFLEEALRLVNDNGLYQLVPQPLLVDVFYHVQTRHFLNKSRSGVSGSSRETYRNIATRLRNNENKLVDTVWKELTTALGSYLESGIKPDRSRFQDEWMREFCDLLVTMKTPEVVSMPPDLVELPLEFVDGAVNTLRTIIVEKVLSFPVQLLLGIYEVPDHDGMYISLPWSSLCGSQEPKFPLQYLDTKIARNEGCRLICGMIAAGLDFLGRKSNRRWAGGVFQDRSNEKLTTDQFSASLRALLSLNLLFSNLKLILRPISNRAEIFESVMIKWRFWLKALIQQLSFISSYEQDTTVLIKAKYELKSTTLEFRNLYGQLQEFFLETGHRVPWKEYLSSHLQRMQFASFLDVEKRCYAMIQRPPNNQGLSPSFEVIELVQNVQNKRGLAYFPGYFCENIHLLLLRLKQTWIKTTQLSFYSPSVISLYEELITLLILLVRPVNFVIPRSFGSLYLPKWAKVQRSTSEREISLYESLLVKVVISFCELVCHIEDTVSAELVKTGTLANRSLHLVVISMINIGTLSRRPPEYEKLWAQTQRIFSYNSLRAMHFRGVLPVRLLEKLVKSFDSYDGKDKLGVVVTEGHKLPTMFSGLLLARYGIAVVYMGIPKPETRRRVICNPDPRLKNLTAAYLITQFWRTNGQQFVKRMKRDRAHLAQRRKPKSCLNCCISQEMRWSRDSIC